MDKQDELLKVIEQAEVAYYRDIHSSAWGLPETIAAAVRSFMGSPDAGIMAGHVRALLAELDKTERQSCKAAGQARAALSAAIGEDIGGGRG